MSNQEQSKGGSASAPSPSSSLLTGIQYPGPNDVKFGRGGDTNYHIGNSRFRFFAEQYKSQYQAASREGRQAIIREVVNMWRLQNPPGRFLTRVDPSIGDDSLWEEVGDTVALRKAAKVLGEGVSTNKKRQQGSIIGDQAGQKRTREDVRSAGMAGAEVAQGQGIQQQQQQQQQMMGFWNQPSYSQFNPMGNMPHQQLPQPYFMGTNLGNPSHFQHPQLPPNMTGTAMEQLNRPLDVNPEPSSRQEDERKVEAKEEGIPNISPPENALPHGNVNPELVPAAASLIDVFQDSDSDQSTDGYDDKDA